MLAHKRCVAAFLRDLETKCRSGSSSPDTETVEFGEYSCVSHAGIGRTRFIVKELISTCSDCEMVWH